MKKVYSKEIRETAENLRIIDDAFFRLLAEKEDVCQEILQTILDDSDQSRLLQLMLRKDAFYDERFPAVSNAVRYYKETEGGQEAMCEAIEKLGEIFAEKAVAETRIETRIEMIRNFLNNGGSEIEAQNMLGVSSEEVERAKTLMLQSV